MKIEIKHRFTDSVIFAHGEEENTIKITLMAAIKSSADLSSANLSSADLRGANLGSAYLIGANLSGANLSGADVDFSYGWKFACSCSRFKIGVKLAYQVLAHLSSCTSDDSEFEEIKKAIRPYAQKSHRAIDLGLLDNAEPCGNK